MVLIKEIYIYNDNSFGDKVFNLIYGIYLYNLYNLNNLNKLNKLNKEQCKINYIIAKSKHTKKDEKDLDIIFPDSKNKINFIKYDELTNYNKSAINKIINSHNIIFNTIKDFPKYENLPNIIKFNDCFHLTYKMYETFNKSDIDIFQNINSNLITDNSINLYKNLDYAILDIRYEKHLIYDSKKTDNNIQYDSYLLYTPQYYRDMLRMISNLLFIIIITDSKEIVNDYILNTYSHKNNYVFINTNTIDSFYLYYNAKHIVMCNNTFSMAGTYFNMSNMKNMNNNYNTIIYYLLYRNKNSIFSLPEEKAISDKWNIISEKQYILNYNLTLISDLYEFTKTINLYKHNQNLIKIKFNYHLNNNNILPITYKNKTEITYNEYLYKVKMITYSRKYIKNPYSSNKFYEELYFDKLLNDYNIKSSIFITKNIWSSYFIRLFQFSEVSIYNLYANEHDHNGYDLHNPLSHYINKEIQKYESLILFLIKSDYGIEFDFIYDYYMFKINEYLNTVKNMKLLIISYEPNLILPFTLNTLINISNHSETYKIVNINNYIYIIFNNIKNYNIDVSKLKSNFINMYNNIIYVTNEDILKEIAYSQHTDNSIGSSHLYKFNKNINDNDYNYNYDNVKDNEKYKYTINIIKYPIQVNNDKFTKDLLMNIYEYYDKIKYILNLFIPDNYNKKELFNNFYYNKINNWYKLIYNKTLDKNKN
jgi:hypothetical protein